MANILQVTTPNLNTDNRNMPNPADPRYSGDNGVRNPVDPTRVVRADGRDGEQTGNTAQEDVQYSVINYESNYGTWRKRRSGRRAGTPFIYRFVGLKGGRKYGDRRSGGSVPPDHEDGFSGGALRLFAGPAAASGPVQRRFL